MAPKVMIKIFAVGAMTVVILIALFSVSSVIDGRQAYREEAVKSIAESYAGAQVLVGPVLVRPYTQTIETIETGEKGIKKTVAHTSENSAIFFPHEYTFTGTMVPSERRHGLYKVPVYEMQGTVSGAIDVRDQALEGKVVYGEPYLAVSVSDVRGIVGTPKTTVNGTEPQMFQGAPGLRGSWVPNLRVPLRVGPGGLQGRLQFSVELVLAGTEKLEVAPVGDSNHIELRSTWNSPLFAGRFLPRTRSVGGEGFRAAWDISSLASQTQSQMMETGKGLDLLNVSLTKVVDPYTLSNRAVKYGILFILLTFGGFFVFEIMKQIPIHPVQYLLVGFGLTIFFLLLISLSEHVPFFAAYLLASSACVGLLTFYLSFVLSGLSRGLGFGAMLTALYGCIYGLLVSEDNALLLGSLLLFTILAGVMFVTRRVDWYGGGGVGRTSPPPPAADEGGGAGQASVAAPGPGTWGSRG